MDLIMGCCSPIFPPEDLNLQYNDSQILKLKEMPGHIGNVAYSEKGKYFAYGSAKDSIQLYDANTLNWKHTFYGHQKETHSIDFFHNSNKMASGSHDKSIKIWDFDNLDTKGATCIKTITSAHDNAITSLCISNDDQKMMSGSVDCSIRIWELETYYMIRVIELEDPVLYLKFSPYRTSFVSGNDQTVKIWDYEKSLCLTSFAKMNNKSVTNLLAYSQNDTMLAIAGPDRNITIISFKTYRQIVKFQHKQFIIDILDKVKINNAHQANTSSVIFCSNNKQFLSGDCIGTVKLWNIEKQQCLQELKGHIGRINSMCFAKNQAYLITGSDDYSVRIWLFINESIC